MRYLENIGKNAKKAFEDLKKVKHFKIKKVLENYNKSLLKNKKKIINENLKDVKSVKRKHLIDRLILNDRRIESMRHSIDEIAKFKDSSFAKMTKNREKIDEKSKRTWSGNKKARKLL